MIAHNDTPLPIRLCVGQALIRRSGSRYRPYMYRLSDAVMRDGSDELISWSRSHAGAERICDECCKPMAGEVSKENLGCVEYFHLFSITSEGLVSAFICEWCAEHYEVDGTAGIPNVAAKLELIGTDGQRAALLAKFGLSKK
jgi:hypothetical protein